MSNCALIVTRKKDIGLYLHTHGDVNSVFAVLEYCRLRGYRSPETDDYGMARLCQVSANLIKGGLGVGIIPIRSDEDLKVGDNGVYVIEDWSIVERIGHDTGWEVDPLDPYLLEFIDSKMPVDDRYYKVEEEKDDEEEDE